MSANLSPRQKEAVELLADGHSWDTAAEEMGIERSTRNKHLYRVSVQTGQCIETILYLTDNGRLDDDDRERLAALVGDSQ